MADLPRYTMDKTLLPRLSGAIRQVSIDVQEIIPAKLTPQGLESVWMCSDTWGQLFSFSIVELNESNIFGLSSGTVYLELGPREKKAPKRKRREISAAFERFEGALIGLGAKRIIGSPK